MYFAPSGVLFGSSDQSDKKRSRENTNGEEIECLATKTKLQNI